MNISWKKGIAVLTSLVLTASLLTAVIPSNTVQAATLFSDDFNDGDANGWATTNGSWSVIQDNGNYVYTQSDTGSEGRATAGTQSWTNYSVTADVKVMNFNANRIIVAGRYKDGNNYYGATLSASGLELRKR